MNWQMKRAKFGRSSANDIATSVYFVDEEHNAEIRPLLVANNPEEEIQFEIVQNGKLIAVVDSLAEAKTMEFT